jgi:hypothetical protein
MMMGALVVARISRIAGGAGLVGSVLHTGISATDPNSAPSAGIAFVQYAMPPLIAGAVTIFGVVWGRKRREKAVEKDQRDDYITRLERDLTSRDVRIATLERRLDDFGANP